MAFKETQSFIISEIALWRFLWFSWGFSNILLYFKSKIQLVHFLDNGKCLQYCLLVTNIRVFLGKIRQKLHASLILCKKKYVYQISAENLVSKEKVTGKETNHFNSKYTAQKWKFSIKDFFSKCDLRIHCKLRIWSYLLKKILNGKLLFCAVYFELKWLVSLPVPFSLLTKFSALIW